MEDAPVADGAAVVLDAEGRRNQAKCRKCFTHGSRGFMEMKRLISRTPDAPWVANMPLQDAVKAPSLRCLQYLVDEVKVKTLNLRVQTYTPLQLSVVWGRVEVMAFLLARGADVMLDTPESVVDKARLRQQRLREAHARSGDGAEFEGFTVTRSQIEPMLEEGIVMLEVLQGVEKYGSYAAWAEHNPSHRLVKIFSPDTSCAEPRYQLVVLRALTRADKASLLPEAERKALLAEAAAHAAEVAKDEMELIDALREADFSEQTAKELRDTFRKPTVKALRAMKLTSAEIEAGLEPIVRNRRITEGEQRQFIRFVRELEVPKLAQASSAPSNASAKAATKSKAKAAPAAKAALLAAAGKGAGKNSSGYPKAQLPAKKKKAAIDSMALMFNPDLPDGAFILMVGFLRGM